MPPGSNPALWGGCCDPPRQQPRLIGEVAATPHPLTAAPPLKGGCCNPPQHRTFRVHASREGHGHTRRGNISHQFAHGGVVAAVVPPIDARVEAAPTHRARKLRKAPPDAALRRGREREALPPLASVTCNARGHPHPLARGRDGAAPSCSPAQRHRGATPAPADDASRAGRCAPSPSQRSALHRPAARRRAMCASASGPGL